MLTLRLDVKLTTDQLLRQVFDQFQLYCRDEGAAFAPPTMNPLDYVIVVGEASVVASLAAIQVQQQQQQQSSSSSTSPAAALSTTANGAAAAASSARRGSNRATPPPTPGTASSSQQQQLPSLQLWKLCNQTVREQLQTLDVPQPYTGLMRIGSAWLDRDAVFDTERIERDVIIEKHRKLLATLASVEKISLAKAAELQAFRERQQNAVEKLEDVMCYAFVAYHEYVEKLHQEVECLARLDRTWRDVVLPWMVESGKASDAEKRQFLARSMHAVKAGIASTSIF